MWVPEGILGAKEGGEGRLLGPRRLAGGELSHPLRPRFQARDAAARGVFPPFRSAVLLTHSGCLRSTRRPVWGERCRGSSVRLSPRTPCAVAAAPLCLDCSLPLPKFLRLEPIWGTRPRLLRPTPPLWDDSRLGQSSEKRALPPAAVGCGRQPGRWEQSNLFGRSFGNICLMQATSR